jgi:hypothetical protein
MGCGAEVLLGSNVHGRCGRGCQELFVGNGGGGSDGVGGDGVCGRVAGGCGNTGGSLDGQDGRGRRGRLVADGWCGANGGVAGAGGCHGWLDSDGC